MRHNHFVTSISPLIMQPAFGVDGGCGLQGMGITEPAKTMSVVIHPLAIFGGWSGRGGMIVHHKVLYQLGIRWVAWHFSTNDCINVIGMDAVLFEFEQDMCMWKTPFLKLDGMHHVQETACIWEHCF